MSQRNGDKARTNRQQRKTRAMREKARAIRAAKKTTGKKPRA
jgi:hypothetical protein